ncbi:MAG: alpha/beta hydrolase [Balneolaceae bacterium]|nr:MAG: alpha/beta hydrolase [Balneolaceae bacterium]
MKKHFIGSFIILTLISSFTATSLTARQISSPWFQVEVTGSGSPMVLIPGLSSSGEVWQETVERYQDRFEIHVFTLAGFAGVPAPDSAGVFLPVIKQQLINYMEENLNEPAVIIGHSLGGFLTYWIGSKRPDLLRAAVAVDGMPWLAGLQFGHLEPEVRQQQIEQMYAGMRNQTDTQFRAMQPFIFSTMIRDSEKAAKWSRWGETSDRHIVALAMYELYSIDLSDKLSSMDVPTLQMYSWAAYAAYGATREGTLINVQAQTDKHPDISFATHDEAWHFMMTDEPEWFFSEIDSFLNSRSGMSITN